MTGRLSSTVLLNGDETGGRVSITEITVPPQTIGPPLHRHDFDEAFYLLEGELVFQLAQEIVTKTAGDVFFAVRNSAHTLANPGAVPARYLLVCTPSGFERHWARLAAEAMGAPPPQWALQAIPKVEVVGPPITPAL